MAVSQFCFTTGHLYRPSTGDVRSISSRVSAAKRYSRIPATNLQKRYLSSLNSAVRGQEIPTKCRGSRSATRICFRKLKAELSEDDKKPSSTTVEEETKDANKNESADRKQEIDWKKDEDVRKFLSNPSIETLLKVEKKRTEQQLKELDEQAQGNLLKNLVANFRRNVVLREKERLDKAEGTFKALDLNKLKNCFTYDTFYATDVRRFGDGGIFIGNIRRPLAEVKSRLEARLADAAGREVDIWFLEERNADGPKQVCVVQPKAEVDLQFDISKLTNVWGYFSATLLGVATIGTTAIMSGFFLRSDATIDSYVADILPLFGGFLAILGVSEIATRLTASQYAVQLSPTFLIPSSWTGCLGAVNNYESLLPSKQALFDISAARVTSAYATSIVLALVAFSIDGSFNGGDNALYIRPQFFFINPLLSFIQYAIGPYSDELGNVMPQALPGVGVPVDPLAFAGLLGIVITSLNMLPVGRLEGGRITQALFGRRVASRLSFFVSLALGAGGVFGSVLCLVWGFVAVFFRGGEELPSQDEISPLGNERFAWGFVLAVICFLTLFPNSAGTFPSPVYTPPFFRGDSF